MQNRNLSRVVSCHPALVLERLAPAQRKRGCLGRGGRGRRSCGLDIAAKTHRTYCHILAAIFMFNFLVLSLVGFMVVVVMAAAVVGAVVVVMVVVVVTAVVVAVAVVVVVAVEWL